MSSVLTQAFGYALSKYSMEDIEEMELKDEITGDYVDDLGIDEYEDYNEDMISDIAMEGVLRLIGGEFAGSFADMGREMKGWVKGIESKRHYINERCDATIRWLQDNERDVPNLSLDLNSFWTWMKVNKMVHWRYFFMLSDPTYNEIVKQLKNNQISDIEVLLQYDMDERRRVARLLESAMKIKDLIVLVEKYKARCNVVIDLILKRKRRIQNAPFQVLLLGQIDLNRAVTRIVRLSR